MQTASETEHNYEEIIGEIIGTSISEDGQIKFQDRLQNNLPKKQVETWRNKYILTSLSEGSAGFVFSVSNLINLRIMTDSEVSVINAELERLNNQAALQYELKGGIKLHPPDGLSYKELVRWYENKIFEIIDKLSGLAIKLGKDPNEVGKALVRTSALLAEIVPAILKVKALGVATATAAVAGPIGVGVAAIFVILDAFGVFRTNNDEQQQQLGFEYGILQFMYPNLVKEYARNLAKLNAIDDAEFELELRNKYGNFADFSATANPDGTISVSNVIVGDVVSIDGNTGVTVTSVPYFSPVQIDGVHKVSVSRFPNTVTVTTKAAFLSSPVAFVKNNKLLFIAFVLVAIGLIILWKRGYFRRY